MLYAIGIECALGCQAWCITREGRESSSFTAPPTIFSRPQAVPLQTFSVNLVLIVKFMRARGIQNIIIMTPPPVNEAGATWKLDRTNERTRVYAEAARKAAAQAGVPSIDLWHGLQASDGCRFRILHLSLSLFPSLSLSCQSVPRFTLHIHLLAVYQTFSNLPQRPLTLCSSAQSALCRCFLTCTYGCLSVCLPTYS